MCGAVATFSFGTLDEVSCLDFAETLVGLTEMLTLLLLLTPAHMCFLYTTEMLTLLLLTPAHMYFLYTILSRFC